MQFALGLTLLPKEHDKRMPAVKPPMIVSRNDVDRLLRSDPHGIIWVSCVAGHIDAVARSTAFGQPKGPQKNYGECQHSRYYSGPRCTRVRWYLFGRVQAAMTAAYQLGGEDAVVALWERPGPALRGK